MKNFTQAVFIVLYFASISAFAQYTPSYENTNKPDLDTDTVLDYLDLDDDQDGITDITEGCSDFDIEGTIGPDNTDLISGSSYALLGTTVTYTHNLTPQFEKVRSELLSPTQGFGIRIRNDSGGGSAAGNLTIDLSNAVENLFFKIVDFDQDESWTVHVYDEFGVDIPLTTGNTVNGLYMMGEQVELLAGQTFHDSSAGAGPNPANDVQFEPLNTAYFYFPTVKVSQIVLDLSYPSNGTVRLIGMQYCQTDTDGDNIHDDMDSDSDNDGIPDVVEAGGADDDGDGIVDDATDADKDGFSDVYDGGISPWTLLSTTGDSTMPHVVSFPVSTSDVNYDVDLTYCITGDYDKSGGSPSGRERFDIEIEGNSVATNISPGTNSEYCGTETISIADWNAANNDGFIDLTFIPNANVSNSTLGEVTVFFNTTETAGSSIPDHDTDGDGIENRIDLDSDNDGIVDLIEAGDVDTDNDGQIDSFTDSNSDGYHDSYDGAGSKLITGADTDSDGIPNSYPNRNPDGNGFPNFMDLDSDDDGITDNTEAQATGAYVTYGTTDTDSDGIANVFDASGSFGGAGLTPVDTDSDGTPDYLDTDSDDGEEIDSIEGHDTNGDGIVNGSDSPNADTGLFVGTDTDGDGIDDGFDNNDGAFNATNGSLQATSHPIFDAGADRDWRSSAASLDFDGINDHVDFGNEHNFSGSFTIEAWILQEQTVASGTIISKGNVKTGAGNQRGYHLTVQNNYPNLTWYNSAGIEKINITSPYTINNNQWHHICGTFDGSTAKLFIDGVQVATDTSSGGPSSGTEKFILGASYDSDTPTDPKKYFDGYIDEVRIWDTVLTENQMRQMMNQEIEQSSLGDNTNTMGKVVPIEISGDLKWSSLKGYYDMNDDNANDKSGNLRNGTPKNITTLQLQTTPLPYTTKADGDWSDVSASTPWLYGDSVWKEPNRIGVDGTTPIDWNIVVTDHNVNIATNTSLGREREVLALVVSSNKLQINGNTASGTGNGLTVTHYLKIDGEIDLEGESQLIQSDGSNLDVTSSGTLERDQQGTADTFTYNYWSSPVGVSNIITNNNSYTLPDIMKDGVNNINFITSGYNGTNSSPIGLADYWVWKFSNQLDDDYSSWQHVRSTGTLLAGEGFTMKGPGTGSIATDQNYVFNGKPNNGDINLTINAGNDYLVGNPYPSAIDAEQFILDNGSIIAGTGATTGTLYFWEHWGGGSHILAEYQGGYGTYTLAGGAPAASKGSNDPDVGTGGMPTKTPGRYIPVSQGFFVVGESNGTINFNNGQRLFQKEGGTSTFMRGTNLNAGNDTEVGQQVKTKFRIGFNSVNTIHRQLLLSIDKFSTLGIDWGYEGKSNEDQIDDMYWMLEDEKYNIQSVGAIYEDNVFPLGIHTDKDGLNNITIDELENVIYDLEILVHDKELNIYHDLRTSNYEFYLNAGEYLERFEIVLRKNNESDNSEDDDTNDDNTEDEEITDNDITDEFESLDIHFSNATESIIVINPTLKNIQSVELLNILGQTVYYVNNVSSDNYSEYKTRNISRGAYIIKLHTETGTLTKKVLVE